MACRNKIKNKSLPHLASVLARPKLNQTRRHSWFGSTLEANEDNDTEVPSSQLSMYEIKEETSNEEENVSSADSPWWKTNCRNEPKKAVEPEKVQPKINGLNTSKNISKSCTDGSINKKGYIGLQRRRGQNEKHHEARNGIDRVSEKPDVVPKRRSGIGIWLGSSDPQRPICNENTNIKDMRNAQDDSCEKVMDQSSMTSSSVKKPFHNQLESRSMQRRATVHYSSTGRPAVMDFQRRTAFGGLRANEIRALEQMKDVCRDYVVYRLKQRSLTNRVTMERQQSKERWLFQEIRFIENELERLQKGRFSNISKQIGITLRSEDVLRKVFFELSTEIITTETKSHHENGIEQNNKTKKATGPRRKLPSFSSRNVEITWGRICAILAIAGGLAVDCVQQGHSDLVNYLIEYVGEFARVEGILSWVCNQGGWESMKDLTYERSSRTPTADPCYFAKITNVAIGFVVCTLGAVFGAAVIGNFVKVET